MFLSLWVVQCIGAGYKSNIYVENSVYATAATQKKPWDCKTSGSYKDYNITLKGCEGASDAQSKSNNEYFVPTKYYTYKANDASEVKNYVTAAAGATLKGVLWLKCKQVKICFLRRYRWTDYRHLRLYRSCICTLYSYFYLER